MNCPRLSAFKIRSFSSMKSELLPAICEELYDVSISYSSSLLSLMELEISLIFFSLTPIFYRRSLVLPTVCSFTYSMILFCLVAMATPCLSAGTLPWANTTASSHMPPTTLASSFTVRPPKRSKRVPCLRWSIL